MVLIPSLWKAPFLTEPVWLLSVTSPAWLAASLVASENSNAIQAIFHYTFPPWVRTAPRVQRKNDSSDKMLQDCLSVRNVKAFVTGSVWSIVFKKVLRSQILASALWHLESLWPTMSEARAILKKNGEWFYFQSMDSNLVLVCAFAKITTIVTMSAVMDKIVARGGVFVIV